MGHERNNFFSTMCYYSSKQYNANISSYPRKKSPFVCFSPLYRPTSFPHLGKCHPLWPRSLTVNLLFTSFPENTLILIPAGRHNHLLLKQTIALKCLEGLRWWTLYSFLYALKVTLYSTLAKSRTEMNLQFSLFQTGGKYLSTSRKFTHESGPKSGNENKHFRNLRNNFILISVNVTSEVRIIFGMLIREEKLHAREKVLFETFLLQFRCVNECVEIRRKEKHKYIIKILMNYVS